MLNLLPSFIESRAKNGKSAWCVDTRYVLKDGTRKFFKTRLDALRAVELLSQSVSHAAKTSNAWKWTFADLQEKFEAKVWKDFKSGYKSETNFVDRQRHTRQFIKLLVDDKPIAKMLVKDLTKGMVAEEIMDQLGDGRTQKTVNNILGSVNQMILYSQIMGCRETNPLEGVERRGSQSCAEKNKAQKIHPEIIDAIMSKMTQEWQLTMRFACTTGLRQGEQRALTWGCLDLDSSKVRVTRSVKHRTQKIGVTKTTSGDRTVPLTRDMVQSLKELYIRRGRPTDDTLVFCSNIGTLRMPSKFLKALHRACDAAGVDRIRWHDLRHFYASKLLMAYSDDLYRVKSYMGHKTIQITQDIYGHWLDTSGEDTDAVDRLSAIF